MRALRNIFLTGLVTVLPVAVTLYLLYWLASTAEAVLGVLIRFLIPDAWYWPGMGVGAAVALIFVAGALADAWIVSTILRLAEGALERTPLVKTLFGGVRDLFSFISGSGQAGFSRTVHVALTPEIGLVGFVTREDVDRLAPEGQREDRIAVYLPMSYQIGGFTLLVPRSKVTPLDIPAPEALRLVLTAGVMAPPRNGNASAPATSPPAGQD